jgi:DNA-binding transcriptional MerR regulator
MSSSHDKPAPSSAGLPDSSDAPAEGRYSVAEAARMFSLPEARLRYWSQTGFITPSIRATGRRFYAFTDLVAIKVAKELLDDGHPLKRVRRSLDALREQVPGESSPLSRLRIRSDHDRIVVDAASGRFEASTGQLLMDFDLEDFREQVAEVRALPWVGSDSATEFGTTAYDAFLHGNEAEGRWHDEGAPGPEHPDFIEAQTAYHKAVEADPAFAAAWTNLGGLAAAVGDLDTARDHFDEALRCDPDQFEARCNLAELALRDGDAELAIDGFRSVLVVDPDHLEAHYGLARALLRVGGHAQAKAHLERFCQAVETIPQPSRPAELVRRRDQAAVVLRSLARGRD